MTLDCPVCREGELTFDIYTDSDGDGPWSRSFTVAELDSQTCGCDIPDSVLTDLERRAVEAAFEAEAPDL